MNILSKWTAFETTVKNVTCFAVREHYKTLYRKLQKATLLNVWYIKTELEAQSRRHGKN